MQNQQRTIRGYSNLSQHNIDLINEVKRHEADVAVLFRSLRDHIAGGSAMFSPPQMAEANRQLSVARASLESGFAHMVRAAAAPECPWI